jgi:uncharacterized membrane protein YraQ (UPF0718 family)
VSELARDKRFLLACLLGGLIAALFWAGTRYPALNEKALMGGGLVLEDPMGFEAALRVEPGDAFLRRVGFTAVNWISTNSRGMTFGVLFAAVFMTLLPLVRGIRFEGALPNTLFGVLLGAPLGVCVNCAAPIARGMHAAGARLETSLATMISSPTLNIIVLAMLFSLFPLHLIVAKLAGVFVAIVVVIPLISRPRFAGRAAMAADLGRLQAEALPVVPEEVVAGAVSGWGEALGWIVREYPRNLWFILKKTVPLMLLAGLLGAVAITAAPWEVLAQRLPENGTLPILAGMAGLSVIALLLPLPIAFDVVVTAALYAGGMPVFYTAVLLFSLGIFSVYSFFIVWQAVGLRLAASLSLALLAISVAAGVGARLYERIELPRHRAVFDAFVASDLPPSAVPALPVAMDDERLLAELSRTARRWEPAAVAAPPGLAVDRVAWRPRRTGDGPAFRRIVGEELGIQRVDSTTVGFKFTAPYYRNWPIAAGDVHGDGWVDLLVGSDHGLFLYANRAGAEFTLQRIDLPELAGFYVGLVALVDLNGDGWLDIFFSAYRNGNHVLYNEQGRFPPENHERLPDTGASTLNAAAFGDIDRDGRLDMVYGNWTAGPNTRRPPEASRNALVWSEPQGWQVELLPAPPGETLSTLLSDIDLDGDLDLLVGNDFEIPDFVYFGGGGRELSLVDRSHGLIPHTTTTTMSFDSADIDNDLRPEIYIGQVTGGARGQTRRQDIWPTPDVCDEYADANEEGRWKARCLARIEVWQVIRAASRSRDPTRCLEIPDRSQREDCIAYLLLRRAIDHDRDPAQCELFPERWTDFAHICRVAFEPVVDHEAMLHAAVPQILNHNVLLAPKEGGGYEDRARELGIDVGGWSWSGKFADVDNDGWQDLYVANGHNRSATREANLFYRNLGGQGFADATEAAGLLDHLSTGAYVYADLDEDGALDIVSMTFDGPVWVQRNQGARGRAVGFELRDDAGNPFGVGSRIVVHYGPGGELHQMREIKAGGGFLAFDPPLAHFGLGDHAGVERVEVFWSTGERSELRGDFEAGHRYRIRRAAAASASAAPSSAGTPAHLAPGALRAPAAGS